MSEVVPANTALMSFIERAAKDESFDVAKFGELLRLQREVQHDQARQAFNAAMSDAQAEMIPVVRDAENTHLRNKYAKLETIDAAIRPIYTRHGFSVRYGSAPSPREGDIRIICTVAHSGGYFEENHLDAPLGTAGAQGARTATTPVQGVGSAITYLRRYLLSMVFNVVMADEDDDGEFARRSAAATAMPRGARVTEPAPNGNGARKRTVGEFLAALRLSGQDALREPNPAEAVNRLVCGEEVLRMKAYMKDQPLAELNAIITELLVAITPAAPPDATVPELADVEISGADKVLAGD